MSKAIAFFPWVFIEKPIAIGAVRLLPYLKGRLPGNLPHALQDDIEGVFQAYSNRPQSPVSRGVLLEVGDWYSGMDVTPEILETLYRSKEILAFSALSKRTLFHGHFDYTNSDAYILIVQRYKPGEDRAFSFTTRRRDGGTTQLWSSGEFAFQRPSHVNSNWKFDIDSQLVEALLTLPPEEKGIYESILEFNAANTDSSAVPPHVEVVMCKTALEWLLGIDEHRVSLTKELTRLFPVTDDLEVQGLFFEKWLNRWKSSDLRAISAWAHDFCAVRGSAAHGKEMPSSFVWGEKQHLAFVSVLFPLLVKKVLSENGSYALTNEDTDHICCLEGYLQYDPFSSDSVNAEGLHSWAEVRSMSRMKGLSKHLSEHLSRILSH
jgi:hypothetical protein